MDSELSKALWLIKQAGKEAELARALIEHLTMDDLTDGLAAKSLTTGLRGEMVQHSTKTNVVMLYRNQTITGRIHDEITLESRWMEA